MNRSTILAMALLLGALVPALADDNAGPATPKAAKGVVRLPHLRVDTARGEVVLDAKVCLNKGPLELLVCAEGTKEYESILATEVAPANLHAAMLLLGLRPGKPAEYLPPRDGQEGVFLPPRGAEMTITFRWKDKGGKVRTASAGEWLAPAGEGKFTPPKAWVFVGSDVLPDGTYWAEKSGDLICVANFASAVIDVPFKSSAKNQNLDYQVASKVVPPVGTEVEVVLKPTDGAASAPHARATLEIDRFGRLRMDGKPIEREALVSWAERYLARHERGRVVIRTAPETLAAHLEMTKRELEFGGVEDIEEQRLVPLGRLLPRTPDQAREAMRAYDKGFENPEWTVPDPVESAREELAEIRRELEELQRRSSLLKEYRQYLRDKLDAHRASTQPSGPVDDAGSE